MVTPDEGGYLQSGPCLCGEELRLVDEQERAYHDGTWVIAEARCAGLFCPPMLLQQRGTLAELKKTRAVEIYQKNTVLEKVLTGV